MAAFRTLRRMLNAAVETRHLRAAPKIKGLEEVGRTTLIEPWMEKRLLAHAQDPLDDVIVHHGRHRHAAGRGHAHAH